jgi:hypothetical protein
LTTTNVARAPKSAADFIATDWKPLRKNTLQGFCTITLPSGLRIKECSFHERDGKRWVGLPGRPWQKPDGATGYVSFLDFSNNQAKDRFQQFALAAIDTLLLGVHAE